MVRCIAEAGLLALTFVPPLLSQPYVDTSAPAWTSLMGYETVAAAALSLRLPVTAFVVGFAALVAALVGSAGAGAKVTPLVFLPLAVLLYNVGSRRVSWARTVPALLGGGALALAGLWVNRMTVGAGEFRGGLDVLAALAPMPLAWAMGSAARTRRALLVAAEQRAAEAGRARRAEAARATQEERARIAREMHDVVAHSLTLLVVHAETPRARGDELSDWARAQVDGPAAAGRQSGGELRELLRMLRDPADAAPLHPVPGLGELDALPGRPPRRGRNGGGARGDRPGVVARCRAVGRLPRRAGGAGQRPASRARGARAAHRRRHRRATEVRSGEQPRGAASHRRRGCRPRPCQHARTGGRARRGSPPGRPATAASTSLPRCRGRTPASEWTSVLVVDDEPVIRAGLSAIRDPCRRGGLSHARHAAAREGPG
ncbi:histidine kinase dimerization/phosphoacceptor domain-containing protein [Streptomyces sp. G5(2025)]|uniref:histidine kinase dimerization/phosphoacceptor domain-containing protein n=1 Tax=Streptomyces sp. G5(2025) TaxID=3406628 RepID=UPI003C16D32B